MLTVKTIAFKNHRVNNEQLLLKIIVLTGKTIVFKNHRVNNVCALKLLFYAGLPAEAKSRP